MQLLAALLMKVQHADGRTTRSWRPFEPLLAEALERTRRLMFELRPQILDGAGVAVALEEVAKGGTWDELVIDIQMPRQSDTTETLIYRSVRELIINARKHSHAERLEVRGRQYGEYVTFDVEDDGDRLQRARGARPHAYAACISGSTRRSSAHAWPVARSRSTRLPGSGARLRLMLPADPASGCTPAA